MKWARRILVVVLLLVIVTAGVSYCMFRSTPSWYHPSRLTVEQQKEAANSADQKLADVLSWAAAVQAQNVRREHGTTLPTEPVLGDKTVKLTDEELNSFIGAWNNPDKSRVQRELAKYFSDGRVMFLNGKIMIVGQSRDLGTLVSAEFDPTITSNGQLDFPLSGIMAGSLPVPESMLGSRLRHVERVLREQLPDYQQSADIDSMQVANGSAVLASMLRLILDGLNDKPSPAVVFVPFSMQDLRDALPVRLTGITASDGSLEMTLTPLTADEQKKVLEEIKAPYEAGESGEQTGGQ